MRVTRLRLKSGADDSMPTGHVEHPPVAADCCSRQGAGLGSSAGQATEQRSRGGGHCSPGAPQKRCGPSHMRASTRKHKRRPAAARRMSAYAERAAGPKWLAAPPPAERVSCRAGRDARAGSEAGTASLLLGPMSAAHRPHLGRSCCCSSKASTMKPELRRSLSRTRQLARSRAECRSAQKAALRRGRRCRRTWRACAGIRCIGGEPRLNGYRLPVPVFTIGEVSLSVQCPLAEERVSICAPLARDAQRLSRRCTGHTRVGRSPAHRHLGARRPSRSCARWPLTALGKTAALATTAWLAYTGPRFWPWRPTPLSATSGPRVTRVLGAPLLASVASGSLPRSATSVHPDR